MTDHFDDDTSFWHDDPDHNWTHRTGPTRRMQGGSFERTREHKVVSRRAMAPEAADLTVDDADAPELDEFGDDRAHDAWEQFGRDGRDGVDAWVEPRRTVGRTGSVGVDPRLMRLGALAAAAVVLIPIVLALTDGASGAEVRTEDVPVSVVTTAAPQVLNDMATPNTGVPITAAARLDPTVVPAESADDVTEVAGASGEADTEEAPDCAGTYTVVAGDYWLRFVDSSGATLDEWLGANAAQADTQMYEGDELCIPGGAEAPDPIAVTTAAPQTTAPETTAAPVATPAPAPAPETTPAPAPAAAAAPAADDDGPAPLPPAASASQAEVQALIREIWPDDIEERALGIAYNEARWRADLNNWCCYGVFAIHFDAGSSHGFLQRFGVTRPEQLFDARLNITIAYELYKVSGWGPWSQTDPGA